MSLKDIIHAIFSKMAIIVIFPIIFVSLYSYSNYKNQRPYYVSNAQLYVLSFDDGINSADMLLAQKLIINYRQFASSVEVRQRAAKLLGRDNLGDCNISIVENTTEYLINITVTSSNPALASNVSNAVAESAKGYINDMLKIDSVSLWCAASPATSPAGPIRQTSIILSGIVGIAVGIILVLIIELSNTKIKSTDDIEKNYNFPILAEIEKNRKIIGKSKYDER